MSGNAGITQQKSATFKAANKKLTRLPEQLSFGLSAYLVINRNEIPKKHCNTLSLNMD